MFHSKMCIFWKNKNGDQVSLVMWHHHFFLHSVFVILPYFSSYHCQDTWLWSIQLNLSSKQCHSHSSGWLFLLSCHSAWVLPLVFLFLLQETNFQWAFVFPLLIPQTCSWLEKFQNFLLQPFSSLFWLQFMSCTAFCGRKLKTRKRQWLRRDPVRNLKHLWFFSWLLWHVPIRFAGFQPTQSFWWACLARISPLRWSSGLQQW